MKPPYSPKQVVYRDVLSTMLNKMPSHTWDGLITFAPLFHIDLEDETMFRIHLNEQIAAAAEGLKREGEPWPHDFEKLAELIAVKIPELT